MQIPSWSGIAAAWLLLSLAEAQSSGLRIISGNSDPLPYVRLLNSAWIPPGSEHGFLRLTNETSALVFHNIQRDRYSESFEWQAEIRVANPQTAFRISFIDLNGFRSKLVGGTAVFGRQLVLEVSLTKQSVTIRHDGAILVSTPRAPVTVGQWVPVTFTLDELGKVSVLIDDMVIVPPVQTSFPPVQGRFLIESTGALDLRKIRIAARETDRPLVTRWTATPTSVRLTGSISAEDAVVKVDGSIVPSSRLAFGDFAVTYFPAQPFAPGRHLIEVWSSFENRLHREFEYFQVQSHGVSPTNSLYVRTVSPSGIVTQAQNIAIELDVHSEAALEAVRLELNGVPLPHFELIRQPGGATIIAPIDVCPGEHGYRLLWKNANGEAAEFSGSFELIGELMTVPRGDGTFRADFPPGFYSVYRSAVVDERAEVLIGTARDSWVLAGDFSGASPALQPLTNENGDRAVLYLNGEMLFRFQLSKDTASLYFERLFGDCARQLEIQAAGDRKIAIRRGRGKLQFSLDLLEWHDAGPDFCAAGWTVPRRMFFREIY